MFNQTFAVKRSNLQTVMTKKRVHLYHYFSKRKSISSLISNYYFSLILIGIGILGGISPMFGQQVINLNLSGSCVSAAQPVSLSLSTNISASTYNWTVSCLGQTSNLASPTFAITSAGLCTVTLVTTNPDATIDTTFTLFPKPVVDFSAANTSVCVGQAVLYTSSITSGTSPFSYNWNFSGGTATPGITAPNPSVTWSTSGFKNVSLNITDANACVANKTMLNYQEVLVTPSAAFTVNIPNSCALPINVSFTSAATAAGLTHNWDFGVAGGTSNASNPTFGYTTSGSYTVTHTVSNGVCTTTASQTIQIGINPPSIGSLDPDNTICAGSSIQYQWLNPTANYTLTWSFPNGTPPQTYTQQAGGSSTVPPVTFPLPGNYTITAVLQDNTTLCSSTATMNLTVNAAPNVNFTANDTTNCTAPFNVNFTSIVSGGNIYSWNFGVPSGNSVLANPSYNYTAQGAYDVSLTVTGPSGCVTTLVKPSYIRIAQPSAAFTVLPSSGCAGDSIYFNNQSSSGIVPIVSYAWTLTPGSYNGTAASPNPPPKVYSVGPHLITLVVTDGIGCTSSATFNLQVGPHTNNIDFTASPNVACASDQISFLNLTPLSGTGISVTWQYGDGLQGPGTTHGYDTLGIFTPCIIINNNGCRDTFCKNNLITINGVLAKFESSETNICTIPTTVQFTNQSVNASPNPIWTVTGPNTNSVYNTNNCAHTFTAPGTYTVKLEVSGSGSCTDTKTQIIKVQPIDVTALPPSIAIFCPPAVADFSLNNTQTGESYSWKWGDGTSQPYGPLQTPFSHQYNTIGTFTPQLYIKNTIGCGDTITLAPITLSKPQATISATPVPAAGCGSVTVTFENTAPTPPGAIILWDFGTAGSGAGSPYTHTFSTNGTYDVILYVIDGNGCQGEDTLIGAVQVGKPQAIMSPQFAAYCLDPNIPVTFNNTSTGTGLYYSWDFGGAITNTALGVASPNAYYAANGTYNVQLIVQDVLGCKDTATTTVTVTDVNLNFTADTTTTPCPPLLVHFTPSINAPHNVISYNWNLENGLGTSTNPPSPADIAQWEYFYPGNYDIEVNVITDAGCKDTFKIPNYIQIFGPTATYDFTPKSGCPYTDVVFTMANQVDVVNWQWLFGENGASTSNLNPVTHTYTQAGQTFFPALKVSNLAGCDVLLPLKDSLVIFQPPTASFIADDYTVCISTPILLTNTSTAGDAPITSISWDIPLGTPSSAATQTVTTIYNTVGLYDVSLYVTDANGCKDTLILNDTLSVTASVTPLATTIDKVSVTGDTQIQLDYQTFANPNLDFNNYNLYRRDGASPAVLLGSINNLNTTSYTDNTPTALTTSYCYTVEVENACGIKSPMSPEHCTMELSANSTQSGVVLTWNGYAGWANVANYNIYRVNDYNTAANQLIGTVNGNTTAFVDSATDCINVYSYRVEAIQNGMSSWSDTTKKAGLTTGIIPLNLNMMLGTVVNNQSVLVKWEPLPYIRRLKELQIQRDNGNGYTTIQTFAAATIPATNEYTDNQVEVKTQVYRYRIFAIDSCDQQTQLGQISTNILLTALNTGGGITLNWSPYLNWAGGVDVYQIDLFNENTGLFVTLGTVSGTTNTYVDDTVLFAQSQNCYRILAYEKNGNRQVSESNQACSAPDAALFAPTAFTPNNDGVNDVFYFKGNFVKEYHVWVFDRWGRKMFESTNMNDGWDGTYQGKPAPEGVYTYRVEVANYNGEKGERNGTITLLR